MDNQGLTTVQLSKRLRADKVLTIRPQSILGWIGRDGYPQPIVLSQRSGQAHRWRYADVLRWLAEESHRGKEPVDERSLRTRKLAADAELAELSLGEKSGRLLERHAVETKWFEITRQIRDGILMIPDRLAGLLLNQSEQTKIHAILTKELTKALSELADQIAMMPARERKTFLRSKRATPPSRL